LAYKGRDFTFTPALKQRHATLADTGENAVRLGDRAAISN